MCVCVSLSYCSLAVAVCEPFSLFGDLAYGTGLVSIQDPDFLPGPVRTSTWYLYRE